MKDVDSDLDLVLSFDVVCIYDVNFWPRNAILPAEWRLIRRPDSIVFLIPKFHLWAHKIECHAPYSFNYAPGVGQTHAETVEENWSVSNRAAAQTKMMGPGARQDTLEDIFAFHNLTVIREFGEVSFCSQFCIIECGWHRENTSATNG